MYTSYNSTVQVYSHKKVLNDVAIPIQYRHCEVLYYYNIDKSYLCGILGIGHRCELRGREMGDVIHCFSQSVRP